jgi:pimeloyl-ACP methyl ester carboxylesterase
MALASAEADLRSVLPEVEVPTLLVHGGQDVRATREVADGLRSGIAGSRLVVLPGVGHVSPVEAPEKVSRVLGDFLRELEDQGWERRG